MKLNGWQLKQLHLLLVRAGTITNEDRLTLEVIPTTADVEAIYSAAGGDVLQAKLEES